MKCPFRRLNKFPSFAPRQPTWMHPTENKSLCWLRSKDSVLGVCPTLTLLLQGLKWSLLQHLSISQQGTLTWSQFKVPTFTNSQIHDFFFSGTFLNLSFSKPEFTDLIM
jgi:hypothetical protein